MAPSSSGRKEPGRREESSPIRAGRSVLHDVPAGGNAQSPDGRAATEPKLQDESSAYLLILEHILQSQMAPEGDNSDLFSPDIVDLDDSSVADAQEFPEPVLFYAQGGEPGPGHCFFLDNCTEDELTAVRLVVPDIPGILTAATTAIESEGLHPANGNFPRWAP